jgi:hypothetical protein
MKKNFYPEPFNVEEPPPAPPNREMSESVLGLVQIETKDSKERTQQWLKRMDEYEENLSKK